MRCSRTVGASGDGELWRAREEQRHRSKAHDRPVARTHLVGAAGPRLAIALESRERSTNGSADVEASAVAAVIALALPSHIACELINGIKFTTFEEALYQAKRHRGVIRPFSWPKVE